MYYVYILKSTLTGKLYKGSCANLKLRLTQHNQGKVTSTKNGRPWELVCYQGFINKTDALREEKFLKQVKVEIELSIY